MRIRLLDAADAEALFQLRRAALLDSPLACLASPEDDLAASAHAVRQMLEGGSSVFGAFAGESCAGCSGCTALATSRRRTR